MRIADRKLWRGLEPDFPLWGIRRERRRIKNLHQILENLHYGCLMHIEAAGKLFLQSGQLPGEVWTCQKRFPHFGKGSHNKDVDSRSPETLGRITMRPMQSIQRRPRTSYSSAQRVGYSECSRP